MARTFLVMKQNVSDDIQDESANMLTRIGRYLNSRYFEVLRAIHWDIINDDYTISVVAGTQDYTLPTDFGSEVFVLDATNNTDLACVDFQALSRDYPGSITDSGAIERYTIWENDSGDKKIKFHYKPAESVTVSVPYIVKPSEMSGDSDTPLIVGIDDLLECGARADAHKYKRRYGAAQQEEVRFQQQLASYIWEHKNKKNQVVQFRPYVYNRDNLV